MKRTRSSNATPLPRNPYTLIPSTPLPNEYVFTIIYLIGSRRNDRVVIEAVEQRGSSSHGTGFVTQSLCHPVHGDVTVYHPRRYREGLAHYRG